MQTQYILLVSSALKKLVTIFATSKRLFSAGDNIRVDNIKEKPTFKKKNYLKKKSPHVLWLFSKCQKSSFPSFIWQISSFTNITSYSKTAALKSSSNVYKSIALIKFKDLRFNYFGIVSQQIPCWVSSCLWKSEAVLLLMH